MHSPSAVHSTQAPLLQILVAPEQARAEPQTQYVAAQSSDVVVEQCSFLVHSMHLLKTVEQIGVVPEQGAAVPHLHS